MRSSALFSTTFFCDCGTSSVRIIDHEKQLYIDEPAIGVFDKQTRRYTLLGEEAAPFLGKEIPELEVHAALSYGLLAKPRLFSLLLSRWRSTLPISVVSSVLGPQIAFTVPVSSAPVYEQSLKEVLRSQGFSLQRTVPGVIAQAMFERRTPPTMLVVDLGAGKVDVAMLASGVIVASLSLPLRSYPEYLLLSWLREQHGVDVGLLECTQAKHALAHAVQTHEPCVIRGKSREHEKPISIKIAPDEAIAALQPYYVRIARMVDDVLLRTSSSIIAECKETGIVLHGGGALLPGLAEVIEAHTQMPVHSAPRSQVSAVYGMVSAVSL